MTRIRLGMVGGGQGAFIGAVHRIAARLDDQFELVAGALSSDPERAAASARDLGLARSYDDYRVMARAEAARADGIEAVSIVTPNMMHLPMARAFLEAGIHVICDKPMTATFAEAQELAEVAARSQALFVLTHTYAGYPMVQEARRMVAEGALGKIRIVNVEYLQDWLARPTTGKQAEWRTDPAQAGGGAIGDIGSHAAHIARYVSGTEIERLAAQLTSFVKGRPVDDDAQILMRLSGNARGMIWASQVAAGHQNDLRFRIVGEEASLDWSHTDCNNLKYSRLGEPVQILTRGGPGFEAVARVPAGHPEGYLEAFGQIYAEAAKAIRSGAVPPSLPSITDGMKGMAFIAACLASEAADSTWVDVEGQ